VDAIYAALSQLLTGGGEFTVESAPGPGATIQAQIPFSDPASTGAGEELTDPSRWPPISNVSRCLKGANRQSSLKVQ
jgi:hypothetical protein